MTPEQRFDIVLYRLNSAKSLLDEIKDHIERGYYNTAMNRMYYACFYAVSGLLLQSEIDIITIRRLREKRLPAFLNNRNANRWKSLTNLKVS